ncbi:MAG: hypothetical protein AVDCRST_MAG56-4981 [uncultured Cytophagales bacterium]|uniref:Uncharacterized protein n=1 Tax=uncultured Cytophagales bacterium TaxID=158755 RepID=A0A6J4K379_9SPHI|nr:MAG: hypothetical protein AVDCRST_MAG56-4981 [uncultured Cytophagales bacterium]
MPEKVHLPLPKPPPGRLFLCRSAPGTGNLRGGFAPKKYIY